MLMNRNIPGTQAGVTGILGATKVGTTTVCNAALCSSKDNNMVKMTAMT